MGNPGERYRATRHNLGFRLVERLAERWNLGAGSEVCRSCLWRRDELALAAPWTYMNRSGWAVECLVDALELPLAGLLVAFDDVALPLGAVRLRPRGSPGGHRGLESVIDALRTPEVARLRLGIAPAGGAESLSDLSAFVLSPFEPFESAAVEVLLDRGVAAVEAWRDEGIDRAMNRFNA